jgi:tetratricopeptide (TPR) repeat protein
MTARLLAPKRIAIAFSFAVTVASSLWGSPSWAGDPFRNGNPHNIGDRTEAAFTAIFQKGDYTEAKRYLQEAEQTEANDPLAPAIRAAIAYSEEDWDTLKTYADKTLATAERLKAQDPLRGNLYIAMGHFLQGAYVFKQGGPIEALPKLQLVFQYLDTAEQIDAQDPELNLMKGYLDLVLAVNLPFSTPQQAIERFEKYAAPEFMVDRAIAVAYRDLKQYDKALQYIDKALQATPDNPEVQYLKGQILRKQGLKEKNLTDMQQSLTYFEQAIQKREQLPKGVLIPLDHDYAAVKNEIKEMAPN